MCETQCQSIRRRRLLNFNHTNDDIVQLHIMLCLLAVPSLGLVYSFPLPPLRALPLTTSHINNGEGEGVDHNHMCVELTYRALCYLRHCELRCIAWLVHVEGIECSHWYVLSWGWEDEARHFRKRAKQTPSSAPRFRNLYLNPTWCVVWCGLRWC